MGVLGVNWDDANPHDFNLDLVKLGIATGLGDNCVVKDVYSGTTTKTNGGSFPVTGVKSHGHFAKKIKCLPW